MTPTATFRAMGCEVTVQGGDLAAAKTLFGRRDARFSRFIAGSELNRVNARSFGADLLSAELAAMLELSLDAARATVAAADLLAAIAVTNALRTRLPYSFWRRAHYATIAVWLGATGHAFLSGTDRHDLWFLALVGSAVVVVVAAFGARFSRRPVPRTPARLAA